MVNFGDKQIMTSKGLLILDSENCDSMAFSNIQYIKIAMQDITHNFFKLGFYLWESKNYKYYEKLGFDDVYTYALEEFDLAKSTVKNLINVYGWFAERNHNGGGLMGYIDKRYQDFSYSQLVEIYRITSVNGLDISRIGITPTMSVRQIKDAYSNWRNNQLGISTKSQTFDFLPQGKSDEVLENQIAMPVIKTATVEAIPIPKLAQPAELVWASKDEERLFNGFIHNIEAWCKVDYDTARKLLFESIFSSEAINAIRNYVLSKTVKVESQTFDSADAVLN